LSDTTYRKDVGDLNWGVQKVWSDNFPASTTSEYVGIMQKINSQEYFEPKVQEYIVEVMEYIMENPKNQTWLNHCGMKGGSTAYVLTMSLYAEDKKKNKIEMAYFFNNINLFEGTKLQGSINKFHIKVITDEAFRAKLSQELAILQEK